jgi:hypothetical protein
MRLPTSRAARRLISTAAAFTALSHVAAAQTAASGTSTAPSATVASTAAAPASLPTLKAVAEASLRSARASAVALSKTLTRPSKGWSGKLFARFLLEPTTHRSMSVPLLEYLFGADRAQPADAAAVATSIPVAAAPVEASAGSAADSAEVVDVEPTEDVDTSGVIVLHKRPFSLKQGPMLGAYNVGYWPEEKGQIRSVAYRNPDGFIEVTPENKDLMVSEHFRLGDFLTHDASQADVWPKALVLNDALIDKLELVIADLKAHGVPVKHVTVMSGFRAPQYNEALGDESGRSRVSRHQYGDAADIIIDNGDGRMADLNHDHRVNQKDVQVILRSVERVERAHPDLVGGVGIYRGSGQHGPFAHIDVRGSRARWSTFNLRSRRMVCVRKKNGVRVCKWTSRTAQHHATRKLPKHAAKATRTGTSRSSN